MRNNIKFYSLSDLTNHTLRANVFWNWVIQGNQRHKAARSCLLFRLAHLFLYVHSLPVCISFSLVYILSLWAYALHIHILSLCVLLPVCTPSPMYISSPCVHRLFLGLHSLPVCTACPCVPTHFLFAHPLALCTQLWPFIGCPEGYLFSPSWRGRSIQVRHTG